MDRDELTAWLRLLQAPGLGAPGVLDLLRAYGTPEEVLVSRHPALREFVETSGLVKPEDNGQA